jgi:hypothetical protein
MIAEEPAFFDTAALLARAGAPSLPHAATE